MAEASFEVGVVVAKRRLKGPWASHAVLPVAVLPAVPATTPWTPLDADAEEQRFYAGAATVFLTPSSTGHYRDNLVSGRPSLWVALRPVGADRHEVSVVTADPYEGESLGDGLDETVEAVPMPAELVERIAAYVEAFHVERPFFKRKRDRADPDALARRRRGGDDSS